MRTFQDNENREWKIELNVTAIKRVRDLCDGVNLAQMGPELLDRLSNDVILLCDVIYALCKPQADEHEITDEQFGEALSGDPIAAAVDALLEELTDFIPRPAARKIWRTIVEKIQAAQKKAAAHLEESLATGALDKVLDEALDKELETVIAPEAPPDATPPESEARTTEEAPAEPPPETPISSD